MLAPLQLPLQRRDDREGAHRKLPAEHVFALKQAIALYDAYQEKASACDARIEAVLKELSFHRGHGHGSALQVSRRRHRTDQANAPAFDVREALFALLGKDLTTIDGLGPDLSLKLIPECGDDLSSWPACKAFYLMAGGGAEQQGLRRQNALVPNAPIRRPSGGTSAPCCRDRGSYRHRARRFYRRLSARTGKAKAVTATAQKLAVLFYNAVRYGMDYVDPGASSYATRYRTRGATICKAFGFVLQPLEPTVDAAVS